MQDTILWKGLTYGSLEFCEVKTEETYLRIESTLLGIHEGKEYKIHYLLVVAHDWSVIDCRINGRWGDAADMNNFQHDGDGNWTVNERAIEELKGCRDIDLSFTPMTNSIPINRLRLAVKEERILPVVYVDVFSGQIRKANQRYVRLSEFEYQYENVPNDFEAVITVDEQGIVEDYPGLFLRLN